MTEKVEKERTINPRSLENLKLGAEARRQGKVRRNCTLLPETIEWLEKGGNASERIDELVRRAKAGNLQPRSDQGDNGQQEQSDLLAELEELRKWKAQSISELKKLGNERSALKQQIAEAQDEVDRLRQEQVTTDLHIKLQIQKILVQARYRVLAEWRLAKRAETKERITLALDRMLYHALEK